MKRTPFDTSMRLRDAKSIQGLRRVAYGENQFTDVHDFLHEQVEGQHQQAYREKDGTQEYTYTGVFADVPVIWYEHRDVHGNWSMYIGAMNPEAMERVLEGLREIRRL